jgi:ubiquinone biosynthesis protein COQ9
MDFVYYKKSLMLLGIYVATFRLLNLQGFHIKHEELIG